MTLEELLKDSPDTLKVLQEAIAKANEGKEDKTKHVRFADLSEGNYVSRGKYDDLAAEHTTSKTALEEANRLLEAAKKATKDDPEIQKQLSDYKTTVENLTKELAETKLNSAIITGLQAAGAVDTDYLSYKLTSGKEELKLGEDGKVVGWDEKLTALKTTYPNQFGEKGKKGAFEGFQIEKGEQGAGGSAEPKNLAEALSQAYGPK